MESQKADADLTAHIVLELGQTFDRTNPFDSVTISKKTLLRATQKQPGEESM